MSTTKLPAEPPTEVLIPSLQTTSLSTSWHAYQGGTTRSSLRCRSPSGPPSTTGSPSTEPQVYGSAYAAVGSKIYVIGGYLGSGSSDADSKPEPSSYVWVLDCRSHTWERGPSMRMLCFNAQAAAMDGKVYVVGGVPGKSWIEVLDPAVGR